MEIAAIVLSYLIGSVSFAVVVSRAMRLPDPRTFGSKNPGATNVLRTGRKAAAALTLLGDGAKGWLAVFAASRLLEQGPQGTQVIAVSALAVVIGHVYPVFHRFKGGKGVSTALGVLLALNLWLAGGVLATWIIIAIFFRVSSLAAVIAAVSAPLFCFMLYGFHPYTAAVAAIAIVLIWRHKSNIRNLLAGSEGRIGDSST